MRNEVDTEKKVLFDIIIPTLGVRESLHDVIGTLERFAKDRPNVEMRVTVSFNTKPAFGRKVFLTKEYADLPNFTIKEIGPASYEPTSEHHLLWLLKWYKANVVDRDAFIWPVTDQDPIIESGLDAVIDFLTKQEPDLFYINNLWGDPQGVSISSPAFRTNQQIWHGDASYFFRSVGFEHATSCIGAFMLRSSFVTDKIITLFETTIKRGEQCAHAWWMMEAGMSSRKFYFVSAPILINKMNSHHFDHARTWGENAKRQAKPYHYDWTIGFLKHLQYYVDSGQMTYKQMRTAVISEPQRGILLFLDDVLRRLKDQAKLALLNTTERFEVPELELIKHVFGQVYPLRMPMINHLCEVLDKRTNDKLSRILAHKLSIYFRVTEEIDDPFSPVFHNAAYGYYIYEHNYGFVAVLDKRNVHRAYRDLDPVDLSPYILYAPTQDELIARIKESREHSSSQSLINFFDYKDVHLKEEPYPMRIWPSLQLWIWSKDDTFIRRCRWLGHRGRDVVRAIWR